MLQFEYLCAIKADLGELKSMGPAPLGERRVVDILGGTFEGPLMRGEVLGGGADWQIARSDGALELDARYALREERGGVVKVVGQGKRRGPAEGRVRAASCE